MNTTLSPCRECYETQIVLWRDQEMNETLRAYCSTYISPVKMFHPTLEAAMDVWGQKINPEDLIDD